VTGTSVTARARATPVRQFQLLGLVHLALFAWTGLYIYAPRHYTGGLEAALAGPADGTFGERFYSAVAAALAWGHVPVVYLLGAWGVVLAVGSIRTGGRTPFDPGRIPTELLFWGSLVIAGAIRGISGWTVGPHRFLDSPHYGASFGTFWLWLAVAVAAVLVAAVRAVRGIPSPDRGAGQSRAARLMARPPGGSR
jgi:hypothetical protein